MKASEIRQQFFDYFSSKGHQIVQSAPIVNKDDPTLMFTNAGMNQFKDFFLGNKVPDHRRKADTQKCLRVSGKHNDLEEVGIDSYHHTMFEMLGNWSFGDYFKKEAIEFAYDLLVNVYGLPVDRIYASCFEGNKDEGLEPDSEAANYWKKYLAEDKILYFDKKDNFWEMGDKGPCGPCSEVHVDLRSDEERAKTPGRDLVNMDHPQVIEIWNLVFIQFNRKADGSLEDLPEKHVDTGMGFERLCMAMQGKISNYDTDVFTPFINKIESITGVKYGFSYDLKDKSDIAMRVVSDHLRAVCFTIADGELPGNTGAPYVIRRILRRAVRYYYTFLNTKEPLMYQLVDLLADNFKDVFPELDAQRGFVKNVVLEEEKSFLKTLEGGLKRLANVDKSTGTIDGKVAFELYDTYGFPIDLTRLIASEQGLDIDESGFEMALQSQKARSRKDATKVTGDWIMVGADSECEFVGYDQSEVTDARLVKYRMTKQKDQTIYQLVLNKTPFYAESGGQVGDKGRLVFGEESIDVINTQKENALIVHQVKKLPSKLDSVIHASINTSKRKSTQNNHSATHLLHAALRSVLGDHVQQKGSLVNEKQLRFDFSHFQKMTQDQILQVEEIVNEKVRANIPCGEQRSVTMQEAKDSGAMMLFGEKYGDKVRMITFDPNFSVELCGGCHVDATGELGQFKIVSESAIAAGVRRIEARTAKGAQDYVNTQIEELNSIKGLFKTPVHTMKNVYNLQIENKQLKQELDKMKMKMASGMKDQLKSSFEDVNGINFLAQSIELDDVKTAKALANNLESDVGNCLIVLGIQKGEKVQLLVRVSDALAKADRLHAGKIVKQIAQEIKGGGGGQATFATAGGTDANGLDRAFAAAKAMV